MSYQVQLDVFQGPFDLLLHLISRRQVEVTEIDLADITADYLRTLRDGIDTIDLESATRFLMVAATLIELKAARLLPVEQREAVEDLLGDARDRLYARLLEYQAYRDLAGVLRERYEDNAWRLTREAAPEPWMLRVLRPVAVPLAPAELAALAASAFAPVVEASVDLHHIRRSTITVREAAELVLGVLDDDRVLTFSELSSGRSRTDRVALFLSILELFKLGAIDLEQEHGAAIEISVKGSLSSAANLLTMLDASIDDALVASDATERPAAIDTSGAHVPTDGPGDADDVVAAAQPAGVPA
jgi:segregation and condensation protein A